MDTPYSSCKLNSGRRAGVYKVDFSETLFEYNMEWRTLRAAELCGDYVVRDR